MAGPKPIPEAPKVISIPEKGSKKVVSYLWMPDAQGNLVKAETSTIKKAFTTLPQDAILALQEYLITVENRTAPTRAQRNSLWNSIVDGASAAFKSGKKQSPWDVLEVLKKNSPTTTGSVIEYTSYDELTANALLNKISNKIGFDATSLSDTDRTEFFNKLQAEASASGKSVTRKAVGGGMEKVTIPSLFDANSFTESFIWAKVNLEDTTNLPSAAIKQISGVKSLLKDYNISNLSQKEITKLGVDLASGARTLAEIKEGFQKSAIKNYPQFAERFADNKDLTVRDIAEPILNVIAKAWEVEPSTLDINDPDIEKLIRPDGVVGKMPPATVGDAYLFAVNHPKFDNTVQSIKMGSSAATGAARAMGFGI